MKITIFGAGGIGGYFGARLAAGGAEVHLIARGEHLRALRDEGLRVSSMNGDFEGKLPATDDPADIGESDVVFFCVKSMDTEDAARALRPLLGANTAVVTLQNGVDNEAKIAKAIGEQHVCGGVAYIMATISEPGHIAHTGTLARLVFGELNGEKSPRLEALESLCKNSGIDAELSENITEELWRKFAMICAVAGMTAAVRLPMGDIRESEPAFEMFEQIAREVTSLARREGVSLDEETPEKIVALAKTLPPDMYSSLYYDLVQGKRIEIEALHGTAVKLAEKHALAAPACRAVEAILSPWARKAGA